MYLKKSFLFSLPVGIALVLELALAPSLATLNQSKVEVAQLKQVLPPPPPDNPDSSAAGGRRAPAACPQDAETAKGGPLLTALSPTAKPGLTLANPTFLVYVPKTSAKNAEFSLSSRDSRGVYRTTIALTNTPDFVSVSLPPQTPPLEVGKEYMWTFAIICNPNDRLADQFVTGTVQRTELDPTQRSQIEQTPANQRLAIYQKDGIWYDAIALLFELKRSQPNDPSLNAAWHEFLRSGGIDLTI